MIKLNGYWYSYEEVEDALRKKGYTICVEEWEPDRTGYVKMETHALKEGESPSPLNRLSDVAIKEFHKKPPLV